MVGLVDTVWSRYSSTAKWTSASSTSTTAHVGGQSAGKVFRKSHISCCAEYNAILWLALTVIKPSRKLGRCMSDVFIERDQIRIVVGKQSPDRDLVEHLRHFR